ncbi:MAG: sulfur carrier protein ThiS [Elusimicrobiota bacterium]|jgi:thiamine biosynthesis protein ThiS|nr:sulfur carrier protein ThiS [Elusimicrobiota bacterium]
MIKIKVNGKEKEISDNISILNFLNENKINLEGVFIGYNGGIIRREKFNELILKDSDILEIIKIVAGG